MRRIPELDALRGCAALGIVFYHYSHPSVWYDRLGYAGSISLELFFVLSGFLITSIVLRDGERPRFLFNFYMRRGLRIWPLYYAVIAFTFLLCVLHPGLYPLKGSGYYLTYTQNISLYWFHEPPLFAYPVQPTWTLAIEEQFYILWPLSIWFLGRRATPYLGIGLIAASIAARGYGFSEHLLLVCADGFASGGLLAWLIRDVDSTRLRIDRFRKGFAACLVVTFAYLTLGQALIFHERPFDLAERSKPLTIFVCALFFLSIVGLAVIQSGSRLLAPLRMRWLRFLGQISYSVYLFHLFSMVFVGEFVAHFLHSRNLLLMRLAAFATTLALLTASWYWFEQPILRIKDRRFRYDFKPTFHSAEIAERTLDHSRPELKTVQSERVSGE